MCRTVVVVVMVIAIGLLASAETVDEFIRRMESQYVNAAGSKYTCSNYHISLALTSDGVVHGGFVFGGACELARYAVAKWERRCNKPYTARSVCGWFFFASLEDEIAFHCQGWMAAGLAAAGFNMISAPPISTMVNVMAWYWQWRANPINMGAKDVPPLWQPPS